MKSLSILLLLSCLFVVSCRDDPDPEEEMKPLPEQLIGSYFLFSFETTGCDENESPVFNDSNDCIISDDYDHCNVIYTFSADGKASLSGTFDGDQENGEYNYTYDEATDLINPPDGFSSDELFIFDEEGLRFVDQDWDGCREVFTYRKVGSDPDPDQEVKQRFSEELIGTHFLFSFEITGCGNMTKNIDPTFKDSDGCVDEDGDLHCNNTYTFNADGTMSWSTTLDGVDKMEEYNYSYDEVTDLINLGIGQDDENFLIFDEEGLRYFEQDGFGCKEIFTYKK